MIRPTTILPALTCAATDLDEFAALLVDLADAIDRHDVPDVVALLHRLCSIDPDLGSALEDYLSFTGLLGEVYGDEHR